MLKNFLWCLAIAFAFVLFGLSYWQFMRGYLKQQHLESYTTDSISSLSDNIGQKVILEGSYLAHNIYLANQSDGTYRGFAVFSPFESDGNVVLINRGFAPSYMPHGTKTTVIGTIENAPYNKWVTLPISKSFNADLEVISIDINVLAEQLKLDLFPKVIKALEVEPGFTYVAPSQYLSPERHWGYSLQWLICALVYSLLLWRFWRTYAI